MKTENSKLKMVAFLFIALFLTVSANAQEKFDPEKRAKMKTEKMKVDLSLTNDQVSQVEEINLKHAQEKKVMREKMRNEMHALKQNHEAELAKVFTDEQLKTYKLKQEERKAKFKEGHKGHGKKSGCEKGK